MEGQEHKDMIKIIADALHQKGYLVEVEVSIGRQRYDLVATKPGDRKPRFVEVYVSQKPPRYIEPRKSNISCIHCGWEWFTRGKLRQVTCPNCGKKTPTKVSEKEEAEG